MNVTTCDLPAMRARSVVREDSGVAACLRLSGLSSHPSPASTQVPNKFLRPAP